MIYSLFKGNSNCGSTNGGCEQLCFHEVPSGTSCGCEFGKKLAPDGKRCEDSFKDGKRDVYNPHNSFLIKDGNSLPHI